MPRTLKSKKYHGNIATTHLQEIQQSLFSHVEKYELLNEDFSIYLRRIKHLKREFLQLHSDTIDLVKSLELEYSNLHNKKSLESLEANQSQFESRTLLKKKNQNPTQQCDTNVHENRIFNPPRSNVTKNQSLIDFLSENKGRKWKLSELRNHNPEFTRLMINSINYELRKKIKNGHASSLLYKSAHEGCFHTRPHIICRSDDLRNPSVYIE